MQEFARLYDQAQRNAQQAGQQVNPEQVLRVAADERRARRRGERVRPRRLRRPRRRGDRQEPSVPERRTAASTATASPRSSPTPASIATTSSTTCGASWSATRSPTRSAPGLQVPQPLVAALYRLQNEERTDLLRRRRRDVDRAGGRAERERPADLLRREQGAASARPNTASSPCSRSTRRRSPIPTPSPTRRSRPNTSSASRA